MNNPNWVESHRNAKAVEARLESSVQRYAMLAQKINADFLCDEENPLMGSHHSEEQALAANIERDLAELNSCIERMRNSIQSNIQSPSTHQQEVIVKRFSEIHYDYLSEFKSTSVHCLKYCYPCCYIGHRLLFSGREKAWSYSIHQS